ncbi:RDD family protein [Agreia pratensis]|uniref:RDD family protein n=1 Tax=Agreia pratensis TaxID=150121 RepID=A0A1X7K841_9MICO|nr:RDD family protein [Agreia pratensis]SMG37082.1 RDD family protein [Agreia pratensis]
MPTSPASSSSQGAPPSNWPGERMGFPRTGVGSVARSGRRLAAIFIDFAACYVVYFAFFFGSDWASLVIFAVEQVVLLSTLGSGLGHFILGIRIVKVDGSYAGVWRPALRTGLLLLLIPALIWDSDQRGLHDVFAGTVLVMRR